ncbi:MAG: hypothetical protein JO360_03745 [Acidobacteria bacterium]|nr:hypothetical protein [Acidobacteriota bacterium]
MTEDERQRQMDFIVETLGRITIQNDKGFKRLDRMERILLLTIRAGRRERIEWRDHYNALVDAQLRTEEITHGNSEAITRNTQRLSRLEDTVEGNCKDLGELEEIVREQKRNLRPNKGGGTAST